MTTRVVVLNEGPQDVAVQPGDGHGTVAKVVRVGEHAAFHVSVGADLKVIELPAAEGLG